MAVEPVAYCASLNWMTILTTVSISTKSQNKNDEILNDHLTQLIDALRLGVDFTKYFLRTLIFFAALALLAVAMNKLFSTNTSMVSFRALLCLHFQFRDSSFSFLRLLRFALRPFTSLLTSCGPRRIRPVSWVWFFVTFERSERFQLVWKLAWDTN